MFQTSLFQPLSGMGRRLLCVGLALVTVSVAHAIPSISQQPQAINTLAGRSATFTVAATGSGPLTYQWRFNGFNLPGQTSATLAIPSVSQADFGAFDAVISDGTGSVTSAAVELRVSPAIPPGEMTPEVSLRLEGNKNGVLTRLAPLPDGRFYVAGNFTTFQGHRRLGLARCLATGAIDLSYTPPTFNGEIAFIQALADGRLVVAGNFTRVDGVDSGRLARLNADGSVDRTFAVGSGFTGTSYVLITAMAVAPDGSVFVAGGFSAYQGRTVGSLVKINANGTTDPRFVPTGSFSGTEDMAAAPDGKVYVVRGDVMRLLADGKVDVAFDVGTGAGTG
ncbi:MAG TPA: hypothetical protein VGE76_08570, partial [Opitutaceae bacterium]